MLSASTSNRDSQARRARRESAADAIRKYLTRRPVAIPAIKRRRRAQSPKVRGLLDQKSAGKRKVALRP